MVIQGFHSYYRELGKYRKYRKVKILKFCGPGTNMDIIVFISHSSPLFYEGSLHLILTSLGYRQHDCSH